MPVFIKEAPTIRYKKRAKRIESKKPSMVPQPIIAGNSRNTTVRGEVI